MRCGGGNVDTVAFSSGVLVSVMHVVEDGSYVEPWGHNGWFL